MFYHLGGEKTTGRGEEGSLLVSCARATRADLSVWSFWFRWLFWWGFRSGRQDRQERPDRRDRAGTKGSGVFVLCKARRANVTFLGGSARKPEGVPERDQQRT